MDFKTWLIKRLSELQMRPIELSRKSGVSDGAISLIMNGKRFPSVDTLQKIAPALKCTVQDLLINAGYAPKEDEKNGTAGKEGIIVVGEYQDGKFQVKQNLGTIPSKFSNQAQAVVLRGDEMLPIAKDGDSIVFNPMPIVQNGDLVLVKLKDFGTSFKRYIKLSKERPINSPSIMFKSCNQTEINPVIVSKSDVEFMYKVVAVIYK